MARIENIGTFEMLWDCPFCATKGLLGVTHRACPACGAPQDPTKRYFPTEGQEHELANHTFDGADWHCGSCQTPNGARAAFCRNCGAPKEGNREVALHEDVPRSDEKALGSLGSQGAREPGAPPRAASSRVWIALGVALAVAITLVVTAMVWKKDVHVTIESHSWARQIDIERMMPVRDDEWCGSMPYAAYNVSRTQEVRSTQSIPDGETCSTERKDNGDGSFRTERVCQPRYRSEPIYDSRCHFTIDRWAHDRTAESRGVGLTPQPSWPALPTQRTGACLGCEREGPRRETYTLRVVDSAERRFSCDVASARFFALPDGAERTMKVRVLTGGAVCNSL